MATTLPKASNYQLENRGVQFIQDSYSKTNDIFMPNNISLLLSRGIVIECNFNRDVYGVGGVKRPPYSLHVKIIGNDFNDSVREGDSDRWYPPFFPIHNVAIPEIGEEVLIINESQDYTSKGFWIGRVNETAMTNLFLAQSWRDTNIDQTPADAISSKEKYGFDFSVKKLREREGINQISPSFSAENIALSATYGDVIQQGRSRTYVRHSFNKNNYIGVLEQGINNELDTTSDEVGFQPLIGVNPSIGETQTKTIHLVDSSVKRIGDFSFASPSDELKSGQIEGTPRSMIFNEADQIFNVAGGNNGFNTTLYSQVLGEKLNSFNRKNMVIMKSMLDGITGLTMTVQTLLNAFVEHEHAIPKLELELEKTVTSLDSYIQPARFVNQRPTTIHVPDRQQRIQVGVDRRRANGPPTPIYQTVTIPGFTRQVPSPPRMVRAPRRRVRTFEQKINFEAIIGGEENPKFTAPVEISKSPTPANIPANASPQEIEMMRRQGGARTQFTDVGVKTNSVNNDTETLIDAFNEQKEQLNAIFTKVTDYLSENQFVN